MYRSSEGKATQNHFNSDKFEVVYLDFTYSRENWYIRLKKVAICPILKSFEIVL